MGKTFDALERAEKEFLRRKYSTAVHADEKYLLSRWDKIDPPVPSNGWQALENKLRIGYPQSPVRTILVTGTSHGVGVSRIVVRIARMLSESNRRKVLVVDANMQKPGLHLLYNLNPRNGMSDLLAADGANAFKFKKTSDNTLYVFTCGLKFAEGQCSFNSRRFEVFLEFAREKFDYTILDSAPINGFAESLSICSRVDGTFLVVGAGRTRQQIALSAKKELEDAGGKLLGIIRNKHKPYLPN